MKSKTLITSLAIAGLALAGCSTESNEAGGKTIKPLFPEQDYIDESEVDEDFDPMDGMGIMEAGEYEVYPELGGHATFDLPTPPDHEEVEPYEEYRQANNLDPITYIVVEVDNRDGAEMLKFPSITVFDEDGTAYEFEHLEWVVEDWWPDRSYDIDNEEFWAPDGSTITSEEYWELDDQYDELTLDMVSSVQAAEKNSIILAYDGDDLPDEFTRVHTVTYGMGYDQDVFPTDM